MGFTGRERVLKNKLFFADPVFEPQKPRVNSGLSGDLPIRGDSDEPYTRIMKGKHDEVLT